MAFDVPILAAFALASMTAEDAVPELSLGGAQGPCSRHQSSPVAVWLEGGSANPLARSVNGLRHRRAQAATTGAQR